MGSALYSSTAPTGWNQLDPATKQKFYDAASKGDWTAHEAYDHLVPDTLKDNPDEVVAWMDGNPDIGVPDRDVSRIESGQNGGEYSTDNTVMEVSSDNRSRGGRDMTEQEYAEVQTDNQADIEAIEAHYQGEGEIVQVSETSELAILPSEGGVLEIIGDLAEVILPATIAAKFSHAIWKRTPGSILDKTAMALGGGVIAYAFAAMLLANPVVQAALIVSAGVKGLSYLSNWLQTDPSLPPAK